jgi:hypothetical protein
MSGIDKGDLPAAAAPACLPLDKASSIRAVTQGSQAVEQFTAITDDHRPLSITGGGSQPGTYLSQVNLWLGRHKLM